MLIVLLLTYSVGSGSIVMTSKIVLKLHIISITFKAEISFKCNDAHIKYKIKL